jgi:hypothetical protein
MYDDRAQVGKTEPGLIPPTLGPFRGIAEITGGDDFVGTVDGAAVCLNNIGCRLIGVNLLVSVVTLGSEVQNAAGHNDLEPIALIGQG